MLSSGDNLLKNRAATENVMVRGGNTDYSQPWKHNRISQKELLDVHSGAMMEAQMPSYIKKMTIDWQWEVQIRCGEQQGL